MVLEVDGRKPDLLNILNPAKYDPNPVPPSHAAPSEPSLPPRLRNESSRPSIPHFHRPPHPMYIPTPRDDSDPHRPHYMISNRWQAPQVEVNGSATPYASNHLAHENQAINDRHSSRSDLPFHSHSELPPSTLSYLLTECQPSERASVRLSARNSIPAQGINEQKAHEYTNPGRSHEYNGAPHPYEEKQHGENHMKRQLSADESDPSKGKQTKKQRVQSAGAGPSKRGYNAKKRNEAAQIEAHNALLNGSVGPQYWSKNSRKMDMKDLCPDGNYDKLHPELQASRCMSSKYKHDDVSRCVSCTRRWQGDTCRFQGIRYLMRDKDRKVIAVAFSEFKKQSEPQMNFPLEWNIPFTSEHIRVSKVTAARTLLSVLKQELEHIRLPNAAYRPREQDVRATCDTCITSLFCGGWMCTQCGREACPECFEKIRQLTVPDTNEAQFAARREKQEHSNPFFLNCNKRNEHMAAWFIPVSRFSEPELLAAISEMEDAIADDTARGQDYPEISESVSSAMESTSNGSEGIPSHHIKKFDHRQLTEETFRHLWAKGEPLLVHGLLGQFALKWDPEYFISKHGSENVVVIECQTETNRKVTVQDFFQDFGKYAGRTESWKLKDWPPSTDFRKAFPDLYNDFSNAAPIPNYVRRDGVLNLAAHFPTNTVAPDLGPKMYNAMAASQEPGTKGSTKLHMDMSDAVNIMMFASPQPNGVPGCAAWDLFRSEDSDKIRSYLRAKFKGSQFMAIQSDPIHTQQVYLDDNLRRELWEQYGVKSFRVYQYPGEAIFIPAGCAHQVSNMADIIKVAVDFVSPENVARCMRLTKEFQEVNTSKAWKEDVLQLQSMLWFAWLSCRQQEKKGGR